MSVWNPTDKYWIPVYNILELACSIVLAHPKYVKAIRGKKTDKKDAKWIADLFKHDLVAGSLIMKTSNPEKQSLKNSFLRSPLPISRNLLFFKPLLVSAVLSLPSESFPKSVPIWRLFLRRNTYVHGLVLPQTAMKVQGRKNLFGFPRPDAISNRF